MTAMSRETPSIVEIKPQTHAKLQAIAEEQERSMGELVTFLIDRYELELFQRGVEEDLARLKADPPAWKDYQDELAMWDQLAGDGLQHEEPYYTPEEEREILAEVAAARTQGG